MLAKYRKSHVFFKHCFDEPATPDLVTFDTSFGVTFGIFTCVAAQAITQSESAMCANTRSRCSSRACRHLRCFDILFPTPGPELAKRGIRHFITSAAIPIVGASADEVWSFTNSAQLIGSNLQVLCCCCSAVGALPKKTDTSHLAAG